MAGTIVANTINTDTGVFTTNNAYLGIAKAWVNFAGASGTINGSFNVSSVTRNSTGNYTVNFTTAMTNANYAGFVAGNSSSSGNDYNAFGRLQSLATGSVGVLTGYTAGYYDNNATAVAIFSS
jgi:hypothetical protein